MEQLTAFANSFFFFLFSLLIHLGYCWEAAVEEASEIEVSSFGKLPLCWYVSLRFLYLLCIQSPRLASQAWCVGSRCTLCCLLLGWQPLIEGDVDSAEWNFQNLLFTSLTVLLDELCRETLYSCFCVGFCRFKTALGFYFSLTRI